MKTTAAVSVAACATTDRGIAGRSCRPCADRDRRPLSVEPFHALHAGFADGALQAAVARAGYQRQPNVAAASAVGVQRGVRGGT